MLCARPTTFAIFLCATLLSCGLAAAVVNADTIYVCLDGSGDYSMIQDGIDAAADGDEVVVCDGLYVGLSNRNLDFQGKAITVRSANGPENCIIDCGRNGRGFYFHSGETAAAVVEGFTITNGFASYAHGGAIRCSDDSSPTIVDCVLTGNQAGNAGGAIYCQASSPRIINCTMTENSALNGGAVYAYWNSQPVLENCIIMRNTANGVAQAGRGGGIFSGVSDPVIINCLISGNAARTYGGGVYCNTGSLSMSNCTVSNNAALYGRALACDTPGGPQPVIVDITNCILWNGGYEVWNTDGSTITITYSDVYGGWTGDGNIDADPLFTRGDGHLQGGSPCIDAGDPSGDYSGQSDLDAESRVVDGRVDMGCDEFLDTDTDDLPDWWEQRCFGSPTGGDPAANEDGDELNNLAEYASSRDPFRPPTDFYVDPAGDDDWDGLAPAWDGAHGPKATFQAAIDATAQYECDTVTAADGTYSGFGNRGIDFRGKALTVRSGGGAANCVIRCDGGDLGFYFRSGERADAVIDGLTIDAGHM